jgi:cytochrome c peroxidase
MSRNRITSFPSLWKPTEYRNIEAVKGSIVPIQAGWLSARWSEDKPASLPHLWRGLAARPADPSNKYADDPDAAAFGQKLFFNMPSGANGELSCATCHLPDYYGRPAETPKASADELYYLDPYSGGGSGSIYAC